ncbi:MAG: SHOCT domain-containing protein [Chloroflexi bacterium]|nr:MAG: SHOCT domain-containing protein [Chloroflexota bacterium]
MLLAAGVLTWLLLVGGILVALLLGGAGLLSRKGSISQWLGSQRQPTARQVLDERFARGEIGAEEYRAIREQIE